MSKYRTASIAVPKGPGSAFDLIETSLPNTQSSIGNWIISLRVRIREAGRRRLVPNDRWADPNDFQRPTTYAF